MSEDCKSSHNCSRKQAKRLLPLARSGQGATGAGTPQPTACGATASRAPLTLHSQRREAVSPACAALSATRLVDFYGRNFIVTEDTLVPRAETEMMVDAVLNLAGKAYLPGVKAAEARLSEGFRVLDVGTGSGCVAITVALELGWFASSASSTSAFSRASTVLASDISSAALEVARENAAVFGAPVEFVQSDLLKEIEGDFDVIVANLPYVDRNWEWVDMEALAGEPEVALYAEDGGLAVIKRLIREVASRARRSGESGGEAGRARGSMKASRTSGNAKVAERTRFLVLEADPCQHERVVEFAGKNGFKLIEKRGYCIVMESIW